MASTPFLNRAATAGTCEEIIKRAQFAKELGVPIIMHDYYLQDSNPCYN